MTDLQVGQFVYMGSEVQAVGGQAEHHLRVLVAHPAAGFQGLGRIGERIARAGDAHHPDVPLLVEHRFEIDHGLGRRKDGRGDAGPGLVDAVEPAVAEFALDVAARRHGQMDPPEAVAGLGIETGVFVEVHGYLLGWFLTGAVSRRHPVHWNQFERYMYVYPTSDPA